LLNAVQEFRPCIARKRVVTGKLDIGDTYLSAVNDSKSGRFVVRTTQRLRISNLDFSSGQQDQNTEAQAKLTIHRCEYKTQSDFNQ